MNWGGTSYFVALEVVFKSQVGNGSVQFDGMQKGVFLVYSFFCNLIYLIGCGNFERSFYVGYCRRISIVVKFFCF